MSVAAAAGGGEAGEGAAVEAEDSQKVLPAGRGQGGKGEEGERLPPSEAEQHHGVCLRDVCPPRCCSPSSTSHV